SAPTATVGTAAACTSAAITPVLAAAFDVPGTLTIVDTQIAQCRDGYARVLAVPREPDQEHEQVFLRAERGRWRIVDSGSGISCADPDLRPQVVAACVALGLR
ncbi:MAG TPA: hypothetical protein VFO01_12140, partial [Trebonia sp.]|nr:hypothetical protein [Trebonia sp.]